MARFILTAIVATLAVTTANSLMTTEEARSLAIQLSSFDENVIQKLSVEPQVDQIRSLTDVFGNDMDVPENAAANLKTLVIESSVMAVSNVFNRYRDYQAKFRKLAKELRDVDAEMTRVHRQLYYDGEPRLFDILARNKDSVVNCVTQSSSVKLINQLYNNMLKTEIKITAIELYSRELQNKLGKPDSVTEEMIWGHFDNRANNLHRVASDALKTAAEEIAKCKV